MITLGIEGSANKIGIGIIKDDEILSNVRRTYVPKTGHGFIPTEVIEHHRKNILPLIKEAMEESNLKFKDLDCIAYTKGPGMAGPLIICALVARILSLKLKIPIKPVNHCVAHIEMGKLITKSKNPVILYASGGNTQIIGYQKLNNKEYGRYKIVGETLDIAVGNCLDRIARLLNLSNDPSGGYTIEQRAKNGKKYYKIPVSIKGMDISCGSVVNYLNDNYLTKRQFNKIEKVELTSQFVNDICYSVQESIFASLVEVTERAMAFFGSREVLIVGGVGCNLRLQEMIKIMSEDRGATVYGMDDKYCVDNGAMIAYTGSLDKYKYKIEECTVTQKFRTDSVKIFWNNDK